MKIIFEYINILLTNNMSVIFAAAGIFLLIYEMPTIDAEKFAKEKRIAKIAGIGYLLIAAAMQIILIVLFLVRF